MSRRLDVVCVAYGNAATIADRVGDAKRLPDVGKVVVVDHGADGSAARARDAGAVVVTDTANPGFGAGQNRGVALTTAPFVLLLNPDAEPVADGIAAGLAALEADPTLGAVQGVVVNRGSGKPERSQGNELGPIHLFGRAVGARRLLGVGPVRAMSRRVGLLRDHVERVPVGRVSVASLAATSLLVRREAFTGVGGFDERYFLYGEDLDLCRRLRRDDWELVALPERFALHEGGASSPTTTDRELAWWQGTLRFAATWWTHPRWCLARGAALLRWVGLAGRRPSQSVQAWIVLVTQPRRARSEARHVETSRS
jgi:N-acetylglucosaminyl-diphospho-decaprenol L-rhamnosyltransferase